MEKIFVLSLNIILQFCIFYLCVFSQAEEVKRNYITKVAGLEMLPPFFCNHGDRPGRRINLRCKVRSELPPMFIWEKVIGEGSQNYTSLHLDSATDYRIDIGLKAFPRLVYISRLSIFPSRSMDSGHYRCRVKTDNSTELERTFRVVVKASVKTPLRLVALPSGEEGKGILEVKHKGRWGTVCSYGFTNIEANIACRSLGYWNGIPQYWIRDRVHHFRIAHKDTMWVKLIRCSLNATDIRQCSGWKKSSFGWVCNSREAIGVNCSKDSTKGPPEIPKIPIKLAGNLPEGIVKVYHNGHWGRVCKNHNFRENEVNVICKMLGYFKGGIAFKAQGIYDIRYEAEREILIDLKCPRNASTIAECSHVPWGEYCGSCWCSNANALAVRCWTNELDNNNKSVRLAASLTEHEGRVEVLHDNVWGTVYNRYIGPPEANVFCKMMGYRYGGMPIHYGVPPGHGKLWIYKIKCPLNAATLQECDFKWGETTVRIRGDVGVKCRVNQIEVPKIKFRLIGDKSALGQGRLEYFRDGYWGTVCKAFMGTSEASVFCSMLGFRHGGHILPNPDKWPQLNPTYGPSLLEYLECPWNSTDIAQCSQRNRAYKEFQTMWCAEHWNDAALSCRNTDFPDYRLKLVGGNVKNEGQLAVQLNGTWHKVCDFEFRSTSIAPICKQLGYRHGGEFTVSRKSDPSLNSWMTIDCNGNEQRLGQCNRVQKAPYCTFRWAVYVKCYVESDVELQMSVSLESDGKVIVQRNGTSWKICSASWDDFGAHAACRMLGKRSGVATHLPYENSSPANPSPENNIDDLYCPPGKSHLNDCFFSDWKPVVCDYDKEKTLRGGARCT